MTRWDGPTFVNPVRELVYKHLCAYIEKWNLQDFTTTDAYILAFELPLEDVAK